MKIINTQAGLFIPLKTKSGLTYMKLILYNDTELDTIPHVIIIGDNDWYPNLLENIIDENKILFDALSDFNENLNAYLFDLNGN